MLMWDMGFNEIQIPMSKKTPWETELLVFLSKPLLCPDLKIPWIAHKLFIKEQMCCANQFTQPQLKPQNPAPDGRCGYNLINYENVQKWVKQRNCKPSSQKTQMACVQLREEREYAEIWNFHETLQYLWKCHDLRINPCNSHITFEGNCLKLHDY